VIATRTCPSRYSGLVSDPLATPSERTDVRRDWYRRSIESDPVRKERFDRRLDQIQSDPGAVDELDAIDRLLDTDEGMTADS
jgi:hypothetical protein